MLVMGILASSFPPDLFATSNPFARFLPHKNTGLHLPWTIIGTVAASAGNNLGYLVGGKFGESTRRRSQQTRAAERRPGFGG